MKLLEDERPSLGNVNIRFAANEPQQPIATLKLNFKPNEEQPGLLKATLNLKPNEVQAPIGVISLGENPPNSVLARITAKLASNEAQKPLLNANVKVLGDERLPIAKVRTTINTGENTGTNPIASASLNAKLLPDERPNLRINAEGITKETTRKTIKTYDQPAESFGKVTTGKAFNTFNRREPDKQTPSTFTERETTTFQPENNAAQESTVTKNYRSETNPDKRTTHQDLTTLR